jgi:ABC-2 type transport system permease protein
VARLIALVLLRWKMDLRALGAARERGLGLLIALPGLLAFSLVGSFFALVGVRGLRGADEAAVLPLLSLLATGVGVTWCLSPLLTGFALSETHDPSRLMHFPVPPGTLVASSLLANLAQPFVLAELPILAALSLALADRLVFVPLCALGALLAFFTILAAAQAVGLLLHGLSRNRRWQDVGLFVGLGIGFVLSLLPLLLLSGAGGPVRALLRVLLRSELLALSPFAWGVRAAVAGGRGELAPFALAATAAAIAIAAFLGASALVLQRVYRGEVDLGPARGRSAGAARMLFASALGAVLEKDVRAAWRDPALKASLFMGLLGPLIFLYLLSRGSLGRSGGILALAVFVGAAAFGSNAFGLERRGVGLLFSFPVPRWQVLAGKNAAAVVLRLPVLLVLFTASLFLAPLSQLPAAVVVGLVTLLVALGADNFVSILFPVAAPAPGQPASAGMGGRRGLGAVAFTALLLGGALALAAPFVFLAWLPLLLGRPGLWWATLPLALAGALATYAMLVAAAARLLERREPVLLERILEEA